MNKCQATILILLLHVSFLSECLEEKSVKELTEITRANIKDQKKIYKEGILVISSTEKALEFSKEKTLGTAKEAMDRVASSLKEELKDLKSKSLEFTDRYKKIYKIIDKIEKSTTRRIKTTSRELIDKEKKFATKLFKKSWGKFLLGSIHIARLIDKDTEKVKELTAGYPDSVYSDYKSLKKFFRFLKSKKNEEVEFSWRKELEKGNQEFEKEYQNSGKKGNTLLALPNILWGHLKRVWYGVIKPSGENLEKGATYIGKKGMKLVAKGVLLPVGGAMFLTGRTIYNLGGVVYYTTKSGIKVVSSNVEAGVLAGLGIISYSSSVPTYIGGKALGIYNRVALQAAAIGGASVGAASKLLVDTATHAGNFFYDVGLSTGKMVLGVSQSAVVLGYNALTALPTQTVLTALNTAFFLAYDGPRLLIYKVSGKINDQSVDQLPVGSVLDMSKLKKTGLTVEEVPVDEGILKNVVKKITKDLANED